MWPAVVAGAQSLTSVDLRIVALVGLVALLYLPGVTWGLPSEYSVAINSDAPYDSLEFVSLYTNPNVSIKYPAVQPILSLPVYAAVVLTHKLTGNLTSLSSTWPYGFKDPYLAFSHMLVARNVLSIAAAMGVLITLLKLPLPLRSGPGQYVSVALLVTSGVFTYYSRVANPDIPYVFWWVLSFVCVARYVYAIGRRRANLILAAVFSALAIGTKDQAAGLVLGLALVVFLVAPSERRRLPQRIVDAALFSACMLASYFIVAVLPQPWRWLQHVKVWLPSAPNVANYVEYPASPAGYVGLLGATVHSLTDDLSSAALVCAAVGLAYLVGHRRWRDLLLLLVPVLVYYLIVIMPIRFVYERFMLPVAYITVILAGIGVYEIVQSLRVRAQLLAAPAAAVVIGGIVLYQVVTGYVPVTQIQAMDVKRQLSETAVSMLPVGTKVLFVGVTSLRTLPNAEFYKTYQVMLPDGADIPGRYRHAVVPFTPDWQFVVADQPLTDRQVAADNLTLIRSLSVPADIRDRAAVPVTLEYFVYRR